MNNISFPHLQRLTNLISIPKKFLLAWENPLLSSIMAFAVYFYLAALNGEVFTTSIHPYYNYLADAFLHGQLHLRILPPNVQDLVLHSSRYYLYWPPFPAVLFMPFIAIWGVGFSDIFITLLIAGLNVAVVSYFLRRASASGIAETTPIQRAFLVLFFALGTVHITLAPLGRVYFTGQLIGFLFISLAYLSSISLEGSFAFFLTGSAVMAAMLSRNHLVFAGLWPGIYLLWKHRTRGRKWLVGSSLFGLLPIVIGGILFLLYNWIRFGSPFNVGLDEHLMAENFYEEYLKYGPFNIHYLPTNFFYHYISYPLINVKNFYNGGSLFLLSPVFIIAFYGLRNSKPSWSGAILALTIILVDIPILFLMGTGWIQFGPRYTLEFTINLMLLTAYGVKHIPNLRLGLLTAISIVHYIFGTIILMKSL